MKTFPPRVHAYGIPATAEGPYPVELPSTGETPDTRSPARFVLWLILQAKSLFVVCIVLAALWMVPTAIMPWLLGRTIDTGIATGDLQTTLVWSGIYLLAVLVSIIGGIALHGAAVAQWLNVMFRSMMLVNRKSAELGHNLPRRAPTGEVLSVAMGDSDIFGSLGEIGSRAVTGLATIFIVAAIMLQESLQLGLIVLVLAPVMVIISRPLLKPLSEARMRQRTRSGVLTGMATDIVAGLRILRGVGGERTFGDNYVRQSQSVRHAANTAAPWQSGVDALATLMSGALMVTVVWLGTQQVLDGALTPGQLVAFFGYAVYLTSPIQTLFMFINRWNQALVSAEKALGVLRQSPPWTEPTDPQPLPLGATIVDEHSGLRIEPHQLTVLVSAVPDETVALADRLGRYLPDDDDPVPLGAEGDLKGRAAKKERRRLAEQRAAQAARDAEHAGGRWGVTVGGVDLSEVRLAETRRTIVVSDASAAVFAGTLQGLVDPHRKATREEAERALYVASAEDVWDAIPGGWSGTIDERGRGLSGGQRQRLVLARALVLDPDVLVLVEPTSAVDAHTEARIAERLTEARRGRTTVITTVSPLWLHHADQVVLVVDGRAVATGSHEDLLHNDDYRAIVARGMDEEAS